MKRQNLTEEIYRMRKLMDFDSTEFNENITSFDKMFEEKIRLKNLLKEEDEPSNLTDWTEGGKYGWGNAKLKNIIKYVMEVHAS